MKRSMAPERLAARRAGQPPDPDPGAAYRSS